MATGSRARVRHVLAAFMVTVPLVLAPTVSATAQEMQSGVSPDGTWRLTGTEILASLGTEPAGIARFTVFQLDQARLEGLLSLAQAPVKGAERLGTPRIPMTLPMPDGSFEGVEVWEDAMLSPEMRAAYPDIRTYSGRLTDDPTATVVLDRTPLGFHAQIVGEKGTLLVDPVDANVGVYMSYWKRDGLRGSFRCLLDGRDADPLHAVKEAGAAGPVLLENPSGGTRRTYGLRITTTNEYTNHFGGRTNAVSEATTTINRVRGIYEREVSVSFTLLSVDALLSTDTGYPFAVPAAVTGAFLTQNDNYLDTTYGSGTYDIGHVFGRGDGGGLAGLGVVCTGDKGRGGTQLDDPQGDVFDVDYVSHEIGHQMGGDHTFNGVNGSCAGGNREPGSAYEPGSGSTIMAYAGICGVDNVQPNSDDYFHTRSFDQIIARRDTAGCGTLTDPTGNTPPTVSAGPDYTIPQGTPFVLTATGLDPDGQAITFNWEQYDLGPARSQPVATDTTGPLFRSRTSSSSPSRTLPRLTDLLSGAATPFEVLPAVDRTMVFRVTARDNIGGVRWDDMQVTVAGSPFRLTAPASGGLVECGLPANVTWDMGGGSVAPTVRVDFSSNNGTSFSTLLPSTANDGAEAVPLPKLIGSERRLRIAANDNIFFTLSGPFSIQDTTQPTLVLPADVTAECTQQSPQGATPAIGTPTTSDVCDPTLAVTENAPDVFPLGTTLVTWTATDDSGNSTSGNQAVTVRDTTPPTIVAPPAVSAECTSPTGTPVTIGTATAADVCWASLSISSNAPPLFPLGATVVTWTAVDGSANSASATQPVTVVDTTPPTLRVSLSPARLWPPNHKLVPIVATIVAEDVCDAAPVVRLVSITSSEPDDGLGDGDAEFDIQGAALGTDDRAFLLRAERSGLGPGRLYTVTYSATDASGNTTRAQAVVLVPKSM